ncbi:hypothetical protein AOLI_G00142370 [Acnodon oligacanthus]
MGLFRKREAFVLASPVSELDFGTFSHLLELGCISQPRQEEDGGGLFLCFYLPHLTGGKMAPPLRAPALYNKRQTSRRSPGNLTINMEEQV